MSMLRLVCLYRRRAIPVAHWQRMQVDPAEIGRLFYSHRERVMECRRLGIGVFHAVHAPAPVAAASAFILCDNGVDLASVNRFMIGLCGGNLHHGDPRSSLRRIMRAYAAQRESHPDYEILAYMLRTWNLYVSAASVAAVTWKPEDGLPRIARIRS
jgi:hypothetical protein